ncbi:unnamed protein product [Schistosoma margrebowiei]|uniref:Uncharacterized protein n=1 Tax=Schistosoma margrebowiei TaxID=48269 RepID=A0A183N7T3_9TREM|nr:unnamed protein product [Schistosoma margrebowiei]
MKSIIELVSNTTSEHSNGSSREIEMNVPSDWIKSGTLVEYEALWDCPRHNTNKACENAPTLNTKCIWCDNAKMCTTDNDKNVREFKLSVCQPIVSNCTTSQVVFNIVTFHIVNLFTQMNYLFLRISNGFYCSLST